MLLHTPGKVPGSRGFVCVCICVEPVTLRFVSTLPPTESRLGTVAEAPQAQTDPLLATRAGAHVSTHARTLRPPRPSFPGYQARGHVGAPRDGRRGKPRESGPRGA